MKIIFLYEPSIASNNLGDYIIVESVKKALSNFLDGNYVVEYPTHTPLSNRYRFTFFRKTPPDYQFVCGSNIIVGKLNQIRHVRQWALNCTTIWQVYDAIFIGVGAQLYQKCNKFTKFAYKKMFCKDYIHSVRDAYTEDFLKNIGIKNVINTGCPTMWGLTEEHCKKIPTQKAKDVVFTLTDYSQNKVRDEYLLSTLIKLYDKVYFWPQGNQDYQYFTSLKGNEGVEMVTASLEGYDYFLEQNDVDFVGTRLHGGIRAIQKGRRTLILGIDNRAKELHKDFNIPVLDDSQIDELEAIILSEYRTEIHLPVENIKKFLKQFNVEY